MIAYHEEIAKGGGGLIIVGASTPDMKTGCPTVTCLSVGEDPHIPGLVELAETMTHMGPSVRYIFSILAGRRLGHARI